MTDLIEPRQDGMCADYTIKTAVTTDGRFCRKCLRKRVKMDNPLHYYGTFNDQRGRTARSSAMLGGCADMRDAKTEDS